MNSDYYSSVFKQFKRYFCLGVIVKISVEEQIGELKVLKKKVKELDPNVAYVDVKIGQTDFFVRCKTVEDCDKFCTNKVRYSNNRNIKAKMSNIF